MTEPTPKIGVVTVTYNSGQVIDEFMESILNQTYLNYFFYVVDNASADDTIIKLAKYKDPRIILITNKLNVGVAAGNNQGIKASLASGCSHVLLINNDTVFDSGLLKDLLHGMEEYCCDVTVPKMMYHDNPNLIWFAGGYYSKWKLYGNVHVGRNEVDHGQYDKVSEIEYAPTCCMMLKSSVFDKVGIMDELYFVYYDDADFCLRALRNKVKMRYLPNNILYHKVSSLCGGSESDFTLKYAARNRVYYVSKINKLFLLVVPFYIIFRPAIKCIFREISFSKLLVVMIGIFNGYKLCFSKQKLN